MEDTIKISVKTLSPNYISRILSNIREEIRIDCSNRPYLEQLKQDIQTAQKELQL